VWCNLLFVVRIDLERYITTKEMCVCVFASSCGVSVFVDEKSYAYALVVCLCSWIKNLMHMLYRYVKWIGLQRHVMPDDNAQQHAL